MEKKNLKLKNNFSQLIGQVSKLYKEVSNANNESYLQGRKEALEEVLNWFVTSHNGELKYVSANSFFCMIQEKLAKTKVALSNKTSEGEALQEEEVKPMNFSEIRVADNRKRVNRFPSHSEHASSYFHPGSDLIGEEGSGGLNFPVSIGSLINDGNSNTTGGKAQCSSFGITQQNEDLVANNVSMQVPNEGSFNSSFPNANTPLNCNGGFLFGNSNWNSAQRNMFLPVSRKKGNNRK